MVHGPILHQQGPYETFTITQQILAHINKFVITSDTLLNEMWL